MSWKHINGGKNTWTEERTAALRDLLQLGEKSGREIAVELGVNKNQVSGKCGREGWSIRGGRKTAAEVDRALGKSVRRVLNLPAPRPPPVRVAQPAPRRVSNPVLDLLVVPISLNVSLIALNDQMCKWPYGDPGTEGFHFCGHRNFNTTSYCEYHCRAAYGPQNDQRRREMKP